MLASGVTVELRSRAGERKNPPFYPRADTDVISSFKEPHTVRIGHDSWYEGGSAQEFTILAQAPILCSLATDGSAVLRVYGRALAGAPQLWRGRVGFKASPSTHMEAVAPRDVRTNAYRFQSTGCLRGSQTGLLGLTNHWGDIQDISISSDPVLGWWISVMLDAGMVYRSLYIGGRVGL